MNISLRKMSPKEYDAFCAYSAKNYALDLQRNHSLPEDEALAQALGELREELPLGTETPDHSLMMIRDQCTDEPVGFIWYLYEWTEGVRQVFLSDLLIYEPYRRKGFATAALAEMERLSRRDGCGESILFVFGHNSPGLNLYTKAGYTPFRKTEEGMYLKKRL